MKVHTIPFVLVAVTASVTSFELSSNTTNRPFEITLAPNAIDALNSHGLWAPDTDSFKMGKPNVDNVNATAENIKFEESGLNINELVTIDVVNGTMTAVGDDKALTNTDVCAPYVELSAK